MFYCCVQQVWDIYLNVHLYEKLQLQDGIRLPQITLISRIFFIILHLQSISCQILPLRGIYPAHSPYMLSKLQSLYNLYCASYQLVYIIYSPLSQVIIYYPGYLNRIRSLIQLRCVSDCDNFYGSYMNNRFNQGCVSIYKITKSLNDDWGEIHFETLSFQCNANPAIAWCAATYITSRLLTTKLFKLGDLIIVVNPSGAPFTHMD